MTQHSTSHTNTNTNMAAAPDKSVDTPGVPSGSPGPLSPGRKQLPQIPDPETQQALNNKMADKKSNVSQRSNGTYGPIFLEYSILAEYTQLQKQKLPGVFVIPSAKSALFWYGMLSIRQGLYQGGIFRFSLYIPDTYPDCECPRLVFEPPLYHPVVDANTGELDVKRAFQKWRKNVNHIWQVLLYARRIFYKIDTKNPLNQAAASLYEQNLDAYNGKVAETIQQAKDCLYDPPKSEDPHAIRFSPWDSSVHEEARNQMHQPKELNPSSEGGKNAQTSGLSWMKKGTLQIFSLQDSPSV